MKLLKKIIPLLIITLLFIILFKNNYIIKRSINESINIWIINVFPSLFITFIINDIIINSSVLNNSFRIINNIINKIYTTNGNTSLILLLSILSGTPSSALIIKDMLNNNNIDINTANKLISFTYFSNPLFLFNILSLSFNKYNTIKIITIHYISNLFIGLFFRRKKTINNNNNNYITTKQNILEEIPKAINKSINTLIMILGTITFYMIITNILTNYLDINNMFITIIKGIFEITQGLTIINTINNKEIIKEIIAISIISFGGLSIHTQIKSVLYNTNISYSNFFIGRTLHVLISAILCIACYLCGS